MRGCFSPSLFGIPSFFSFFCPLDTQLLKSGFAGTVGMILEQSDRVEQTHPTSSKDFN